MKNTTLGILLVLAGVLTIFVKHESAWIVSALLIGGGSGLVFWKDKVE
jgi:multisubunit Na+/H+ antiporter MnhG subunit